MKKGVLVFLQISGALLAVAAAFCVAMRYLTGRLPLVRRHPMEERF